jgi:hypothetical protein
MPDSSGTNIFRRSPSVSISGRKKHDSALHKTRYNAYVNIKSSTGGSLPQPGTTFDDTYSTGRPGVTLNTVTIREGQDYGSLLEAEVQFTCHSKAVFDRLSKQFLTLRNGKQAVTVDIDFGLVGATFSNAQGSFKGLMIYHFGYQLDKSNNYVCTFKAMGAAKLLTEVDISATNTIPSLQLVYQDLAESPDDILPVITIPQLVKHIAQNGGEQATFEIEPKCIPVTTPFGHVVVTDHPGNWSPDSEAGKIIYAILQSIGLAGGEDSSKLIYCTLELLVSAINDYIIPNEGEIAGKSFICNSTVTAGSYIEGICSAQPFNILMIGNSSGIGDLGDYSSTDNGLDDDEQLIVTEAKIPGLFDPKSGDAYDYSKILLSYNYLVSKQWGTNSNNNSTPEAASDPSDKSGNIKFSVGNLLDSIFNDIADVTGGAVVLSLMQDPKDQSKLLVVPTHEKTDTLKPIRFDPLNGDGITRECVISCNPASADAYAIAAGSSTFQAGTVEATGGNTTEPTIDKAIVIGSINTIKTKSMPSTAYGPSEQAALKSELVKLAKASTPQDVADGKVSSTLAQWPLSLDITLDGIYGFRFGDVVETTFLPDVYLQSGIHAGFIVQRVIHTIANNEWTTKLETVCDLIKT